MRKRTEGISGGVFFGENPMTTYYNLVKKTIQDYVRSLQRHCRFKSLVNQTDGDGTIMDDRASLIDLYESCFIQDAHLQAVLQTLYSHMVGERYMLARKDNKTGKWVRDNVETEKIQGTQFEKLVKAVLDAEMYGYSCVEIINETDELGRLKEVNSLERRNILPSQHRVVQQQGQWTPQWDLDSEQYKHNYVLINTEGLGLFSAITPLVLAKKYTIANWVNFAHTYGQPIIHGKTGSEDQGSRQRLANNIANAAQHKVLVTGKEDEVDIKTFTMSNSEKIYQTFKDHANAEISNLVLGSESMAGATQSYVGSTKAHEDIFRARLKMYRRIIENVMNEKVLPVLKYWDIIPQDVFFKYSNQIEMSDENKIKLYDMLTNKYEVAGEVIEKEFGVSVGNQVNNKIGSVGSGDTDPDGGGYRMTDEEYEKRYGHPRAKVNFHSGVR